MQTCKELLTKLSARAYDERLGRLYCCEGAALAHVRERIAAAVARYREVFTAPEESPVAVFSGPGRTELGGNHTDHQHGKVLCASVNMDMLACAAPNATTIARIHSEGYPVLEVDLSDLTVHAEEAETSQSLVRGVAAGIVERGGAVAGFDAYMCSEVPAGSGLSSSAAYEVLVGVMMNHLFGNTLNPVEIAQVGQFAENKFFGKPCGLMDEMASSVGGAVAIDFKDPAAPVVRRIGYDFTKSGHTLCVINSGADHADLTAEYAAITAEMFAVAGSFGKHVLRDVDEAEFKRRIPELRGIHGDRAVLRAIHFFAESERAGAEADALDRGDFDGFLSLVRESGRSSSLWLQNTYVAADAHHQAIPMALAVAESVLNGAGAVRVHGGGFAGTVQAFVPNGLLDAFRTRMEELLGAGMCHVLAIRPEGGCVLIDGTEA